jgi:hypothetical protein
MTSVKHPANATRKLGALLRKLGDGSPPDAHPPHGDPIATLIMSFLLWESTMDKALAAFQRLRDEVVDFNDLRVCMPHETMEILGPRYPRVQERCERLRAVLRSIYLREHAVDLDKHKSTGKRDVKKYVDSLEGIVPYVASRVLLLSFESHAIPVDEQLRASLTNAEVCEPQVELVDLATWLASQIKAEHAAGAHYALQLWAEGSGAGGPGGSSAGVRKSSRRATTSRKSAANRGAKSSVK